jgi:hypothetical protein
VELSNADNISTDKNEKTWGYKTPSFPSTYSPYPC